MDPFKELKGAESSFDLYKVTGVPKTDYLQLKALLAHERVLDSCRLHVFEDFEQGSKERNDYVYREYMFRHNISEFALKMSKEATDMITGEDPEENSFVAMCVKNRELYPKPVKKS
jgi:hypothetical protein